MSNTIIKIEIHVPHTVHKNDAGLNDYEIKENVAEGIILGIKENLKKNDFRQPQIVSAETTITTTKNVDI